MRPSRYVADFDSASAMAKGLASALSGRDFRNLGTLERFEPVLKHVGRLTDRLPKRLRERIYIESGGLEGIDPGRAGEVDLEGAASWIARRYPERQYPAIAVGSSNGALTHLWAALGIPWLPQTLLVPVRHGGAVHPDEPMEDLELARDAARAVLDENPDAQLHHMHDAVQDRLMLQRISYFRLKRRALGAVYRRFIEERLAPGGTIFVVDCQLKWPTTEVAPRWLFQHGALGGADPEEYFHGSPRVARYLKRYRSHRRRWFGPEPDSVSPEAEWGFEPSLMDELRETAARTGATLRRVVLDDPQDASPYVADLWRRWYREIGLPDDRLLVSSFVLMDPHHTLRSGVIPFWMVFNEEDSAEALGEWLDRCALDGAPVRDMWMMLFNHGVESVGTAPIQLWQGLAARATREGRIIGLNERAYPRAFGTFTRYHAALREHLPAYGGAAVGGLEVDRYLRLHEEVADRHSVALLSD